MTEGTKHGVEARESEPLLRDALDGDGQLSAARKETFDAHRRVCAVCGPLFADVEAGQKWLSSLEQVEAPVHLVHNILAATTGIASMRVPATSPHATTISFAERARS